MNLDDKEVKQNVIAFCIGAGSVVASFGQISALFFAAVIGLVMWDHHMGARE